ncbi:unnamed protein product [Aphanomyces euteiches]|uniref:WRKY19-like zinc finger domain-containing protein n=1 Tax=Aphanomyces euteiches TaxID=100861 RepID=A0A6G0WIR4_9STRA|nr:hypothetical protein Ae201684_014830 [Aphanomyces euteiches]KAH9072645.1 hypothetical protein Ae201684P_015718 [Aphanomyces euteiches]
MRCHTICIFPTCLSPAVADSTKCALHKRRSQCKVPSCPNQVYARQVCVRHGAKPECIAPNCTRNARSGGYCSCHDPSRARKCSHEGCTNVALQRGRCVRHGGRRQCLVTGCQTHARKGGYCCRHRHKADDKIKLEPMELRTDFDDLFQDAQALDSTLNGAIKFELDTIEVSRFSWDLMDVVLLEI